MATTAKPTLPSVDAELSAPRRKLDLRAIKPAGDADDATVAERSLELGIAHGASTSIPVAEEVRERRSTAPKTTRVLQLRVALPDYLDDELHEASMKKRVTKQFLVLEALKKAGYKVKDADLVEDKRKVRKGR